MIGAKFSRFSSADDLCEKTSGNKESLDRFEATQGRTLNLFGILSCFCLSFPEEFRVGRLCLPNLVTLY
jgi:hypothetical protein